MNEDHTTSIKDFATQNQITFKFATPLNPASVGIHKRGIQSAKFHLRRVIGNVVLTYESFNTILCQIEAILNSRPLFRISKCPEDLSFLCPAHFLVDQSLLAPPEPSNILEIPENRQSLYQKLSQMQLLFWKKWSVSYLQTIQSRSKWCTVTQSPVQIDDIVLIIPTPAKVGAGKSLRANSKQEWPGSDSTTSDKKHNLS
ncbi:uncharacterized protein [Diabrotica undecimpunctata]|uniref:uncharacterized protein n=1 Tax=Diabrotica undecimpunctata TaxID=50387 RepID=UPI003B63AA4A